MKLHRQAKRFALLSLVFALILCGAAHPAAALAKYEGEGAKSEEEAVRLYLEGLRDSDLSKMLSAFAIESYAENFDIEAQLERIGAYTPSMSIKFPAINELTASINVETRQNEISNAIAMQQFIFYTPEMDRTQSTTFAVDDREQQVKEFLNVFYESARSLPIETLEVLGFIHPALLSEHYLKELNQQNLAKQAKIYGADEIKSVVALFTIGKTTYTMCCDTVRYGERWYMLVLNGNIGILLNLSPINGGIAIY